MTTTSAPWSRPGRPRLGQLLIDAGVLEDSHLQAALREQRIWGDRLGRTLVHMGLLSEEALAEALSRQLQLPTCRPDLAALPADVTDHLGVLACERYGVMPLGLEAGALRVATADPTNAPLLDELASVIGVRVEPVIATESAIGRAIRKYYYGEPLGPEDAAGAQPGWSAPGAAVPAPEPSAVPVELTPLDPPAAQAAQAPLEFEVELTRDPELVVAQLQEAVARLEDDLAREVRALRGLVDALIDRGVLGREEFLAYVRARSD